MDTSAPLIVGAGGNVVLFSPAAVELRAIHLFPGGSGIPGRNNGIELVHDDGTKVPPQAGPLVGATGCKIEEILMPVGPHEEKIWKRPVLKCWVLSPDLPDFLQGSSSD
jgi:hypothetical protein